MNPFTESTVARPLALGPRSKIVAAWAKCREKNRGQRVGLTLGVIPAAAVQFAKYAVVAGVVLPGAAFAVDVNVASLEQLRGVRGIGPKTAQIIIDERTRGGKYESFEDLSDRVKGIGPKKASALRASGLTLTGSAPASPARSPQLLPKK